MSNLALARKWRPGTFTELVGQEHVSKGLVNSLNHQRLHHAYLFTGTRGVGKTTIARIFAKALNCEQGVSAEPCLKCDICLAIDQGRFMDLIEVDAASKTGVEDMRALLDNVQYLPGSGRYKVYLIDEVHMLSQHSFNALLKTLEEPPEYVKFLLATTDVQKIPATILSRCLQFHLHHLPATAISQHLAAILEKEEIAFEQEALEVIAKAAEGSMRDALSMLDQAINAADKIVRNAEVRRQLGHTLQSYAERLLMHLAEHNAAEIIAICKTIAIESGQFHYALDELMEQLHQIALCQILSAKDAQTLLSCTEELIKLADLFSAEETQLYYQIALKGREDLALAPSAAIGFEMTLIRMLAFQPAPAENALFSPTFPDQNATAASQPLDHKPRVLPISVLAEEPPDETVQEPPFEEEGSVQIAPDEYAPASDAFEPIATPVPIKNHQTETWDAMLAELNLKGLSLSAAENAVITASSAGSITLGVKQSHLTLFTPSVIKRIEEALTLLYHQKLRLNIQTMNDSVQNTPAQTKQQAATKATQNAEENLHNDRVLQEIQRKFSTKIVQNSITLTEDGI